MEIIMKYLILALLSLNASAAEYRQYYVSGGKQIEVSDALLRAMRGEEVVKCQTVEAKPNKKGTSIGLRNVKKPKAE